MSTQVQSGTNAIPMFAQWIGQAGALTGAYTREVLGEPASAMEAFAIQTAAEATWAASADAPRWSAFDVDTYMDRMRASFALDDFLHACVVGTLLGFFTWMKNHQHIEGKVATRILRRLEGQINAPLRELGFAPN
jgi:hypothetical protein